MVDLNSLCLGCMNILPHPKAVCPYCGWPQKDGQNNAGVLPQGMDLKNPANGNQYRIGKALGNGGFGIVYIAWDINNERKVAIKEYFPERFVARNRSNTVVLKKNTQTDKDFFNKQKLRFREEAQKMQLFADSLNVVDVFDFFDSNDTQTSYIVMEFIEGQTFEHVLNNVPNNRLSFQSVIANLKPIADILDRMHHTAWKNSGGIIHRDISPDNIMYASDGSTKLLDFGAGIIKPGYSPYEQQIAIPGSDSLQGTWTDVYAFAATIYRAITGKVPPNSVVRSNNDVLLPPSSYGISITPEQERILMQGLEVKRYNRYQDIRQFYDDLSRTISKTPDNPTHAKTVPMLTVGNFAKNGNTYTATIHYNGDGILSSTLGFVNGNVLSVINTDGNFNGVVTASEGANFSAKSASFRSAPVTIPNDNNSDVNSLAQKLACVVAVIAVIAALLSCKNLSTVQLDLDSIKKQIQTDEQRLEKYHSFAADYGYASAQYYTEKPIVFVKKNSEAIVPIFCGVLKGKGTDKHVRMNVTDDNNLISVKWDNAPIDKDSKSYVIVKSGKFSGYATIEFTNNVNSDSFNVLVVVE